MAVPPHSNELLQRELRPALIKGNLVTANCETLGIFVGKVTRLRLSFFANSLSNLPLKKERKATARKPLEHTHKLQVDFAFALENEETTGQHCLYLAVTVAV